jgi:hypothetical protein
MSASSSKRKIVPVSEDDPRIQEWTAKRKRRPVAPGQRRTKAIAVAPVRAESATTSRQRIQNTVIKGRFITHKSVTAGKIITNAADNIRKATAHHAGMY